MDKIALAMKVTCKDTSPLISEMMDHSLPFHKRWRIKLHLAMCEMCRHYQAQLAVLRKLGQYLGQEDARADGIHSLGKERKDQIKSLLENQR